MPTLNISLPDAMRVWIDAQVAAGGYSTASEYLRELVRTDQRRKVQERIEALLVEGIESGEP
ncbi:MAG TPA: type II toxin-antitoxin system ParD family antitoxin, partial [Candidatus Hydrogenedentes bacterium]|nr:type II toxin-antitoxin system ParD family antitoxin [Candidatus Hydrogenedentota bacterium]